MNRKMMNVVIDQLHAHDVFCRTITFLAFSNK